MWFKSLYFLSLIGEISPLVDIMFRVCRDIKYFMVIFVIALVAFINAYYLIGKNQKEIFELKLTEWEQRKASEEGVGAEARPDGGAPAYSTWLGAAGHVYISALGEFDTGDYAQGGVSGAVS